MKDTLYRLVYLQEFLLHFFWELSTFWTWRYGQNKYTTETVCLRSSSETAQEDFVKLCSYEGQTCHIKINLVFKKKLFCANQTHLYPLGPLFNLQLPLFAPIHWTIQPRIRASSRERASLIETTPPPLLSSWGSDGHRKKVIFEWPCII